MARNGADNKMLLLMKFLRSIFSYGWILWTMDELFSH